MNKYSRIAILLLVIALSLQVTNLHMPYPNTETYIIGFYENVVTQSTVHDLITHYNLSNPYIYSSINGMSANIQSDQLPTLQNDPRIAFIEQNTLQYNAAQEIPTGMQRIFATMNINLAIDNIDDRRVDVDVAILDSGIDFHHPDLNVVGGTNCVSPDDEPLPDTYCQLDGEGGNYDDYNYHGTHVAGIVGALDNDFGIVGVAPGARLWAVKVMNEDYGAKTTDVIAAIDWVIQRGDIEVINLSLYSWGYSLGYETAIEAAVEAGITVVVAAGNESDDASNYGPANIPNAITVSAIADYDGLDGSLSTTPYPELNGCPDYTDDSLADFSNWGDIVDIAAPGTCILSTIPVEYGGYEHVKGTSMAAPHVTGAVAILASQGYTPLEIEDILKTEGNYKWTDTSGDDTQEPLLDISNLEFFSPIFLEEIPKTPTPSPTRRSSPK